MHVDDAIRERRSIRAFKRDAVPHSLVREILEVASRSPSGTNIQPWHVWAVTGEVRQRLTDAILAHRDAHPEDMGKSEFHRPSKRRDPYVGRAKTLGKEMYTLLEIPKGDRERSWHQWGRNYRFFDAPVGLIFCIDRELGPNSWLDIGMLMQSIMLAAKARGLDTCPQGAWHEFYAVTKRILGIPDDLVICCGMSMGYADEDEPVNRLVSEREPVEGFVRFAGFEE